MFKKVLLLALTLSFALTLTTQAFFEDDLTMLVVPRAAKPIQIAQDIAAHYPVIIVCYQQTPERAKLYAWNGEGWVDVLEEDYASGAFFENPPEHTVLIDSEEAPAPESLIPDGTWCEKGNRLTSADPRVIIHLLGRYFDFPNRRWKQFARAYGYRVGEINPSLINIAWWQYPPERPKPDLDADMENWRYLDITPPPPPEPIVIEEEPEVIPPVEVPAEEVVEEVVTETIEEPVLVVEEVVEEIQESADPVLVIEDVVEEVLQPVEEIKPIVDKTEAPAETVEDILNALKPAEPVVVDPFSTQEIPPAKVILPE